MARKKRKVRSSRHNKGKSDGPLEIARAAVAKASQEMLRITLEQVDDMPGAATPVPKS